MQKDKNGIFRIESADRAILDPPFCNIRDL
jgi:hypothetical protein